MRILTIIITALYLGGCASYKKESKKEIKLPAMRISTHYPTDSLGDYQPRGYAVKVGDRDSAGKVRIWVKGSAAFPAVRTGDQGFDLNPPFYTSIITTDRDSLQIFFHDTLQQTHAVVVYPQFRRRADPHSIFAYGCFQPFHVDEESGKAVVRQDSLKLEQRMRRAMRDLALGRTNHDSLYPKPYPAPLPSGSALIGTGDQVYVDPAYYTAHPENPISAWTTGDRPLPTLNETAFVEHLHQTYMAFGSFDPLQEIQRHLPTYAVWDDHEIRDGWGSQGDEYLNKSAAMDSLNPRYANYFLAAREAYIQHQQLPLRQERNIGELYYKREINGLPAFFMDLRGERNILKPQVISDEQMEALEEWMQSLAPGSTALMVSSIPLFWRAPGSLELIGRNTMPSMQDDILDSWSSGPNIPQRDKIYQMLIRQREERNIRMVIISGDVHLGAINEIWYRRDGGEREILAFEMIVSGLAHDNLAEHSWGAKLAEIVSSKEEIVAKLDMAGSESHYAIDMRILESAAKLNFGALSIDDDNYYLHLFTMDNNGLKQSSLRLNYQKEYARRSEVQEMDHSGGQTVAGDSLITRTLPHL